MFRVILLGVVLLALVGPVRAAVQQAQEADLTGVYACEGQNPDGSPYKGIVEILKVEETYLVRWTMPNNSQVMGVGIHRNGVLAVSYYGGAPAVVAYSTAVDGKLDGKWTSGGAEGSVFSETLTKVGAIDQKPSPSPSPNKRPRPRVRESA